MVPQVYCTEELLSKVSIPRPWRDSEEMGLRCLGNSILNKIAKHPLGNNGLDIEGERLVERLSYQQYKRKNTLKNQLNSQYQQYEKIIVF